MIKVFEVTAIIVTTNIKEDHDVHIVETELAKAGDEMRARGVILTDLKIKRGVGRGK